MTTVEDHWSMHDDHDDDHWSMQHPKYTVELSYPVF